MIRPAALSCSRNTVCRKFQPSPPKSRRFAAAASGSFSYETGSANGVKFASRELPQPTTYLAIVSKAGTRYQSQPGFSDGLEKFAFKKTHRRSALRITREAELLGGQLVAYHSRESLVIGAKFLREDLPYFAELLSEIISQTKFTRHELQEEVLPIIKLSQQAFLASTAELAINSAHGVAFHRGLGTSLHPSSSTPITKYLNAQSLHDFSKVAYAKPNFAVVANGANTADLSKWVGEFFTESPDSPPSDLQGLYTAPSKYYGGEERIAHDSGNNVIIAFPGSSSFNGGAHKPEILVLAALLGGESSIKWSSGFSLLSQIPENHLYVHINTKNHAYSDTGLLCISISGNATDVRGATESAVKTLKAVASGNFSKDDLKKAIASAKFNASEAGENISTGLEMTGTGLIQGGDALQINNVVKSLDGVTEDGLKKVTKSLLDGKATLSAVGDLFVLPFAEEVGLNV